MSFPKEKIIERERRQKFFRRIFRRVFLEDWGTKLIALGITLALWLGVTGLRTPTTVRLQNITLNARVSNDMEITNTPVQEVDIVITGDKRKIDRLNVRDLIISIDLTDVRQGDRIIQLTPETVNLDLPSGIKLDEIQPNKIAMRLENVGERVVDVKPDIEGSLPEGFEIYSMSVVPAKVRVRGAESFIKSLDSISTEKINIDDRKEGFSASQIGLNLVNPKVTALDSIVNVNLRIGEKRVERIFVVPVTTETGTTNVSVLLFGARSVLENLRPEQMQIELQKSETGEETPRLILPAELQNQIEIRRIKIS